MAPLCTTTVNSEPDSGVVALGSAEPERVNVTLTDPAVKREAWADIVAREVENAASYAAKRN